MKIEDLQLFVLAAHHGSISAAGRELNLSPASASTRLSGLERTLGTTLLSRTTRRISLTEDGTDFLRSAKIIVAEMAEARETLKSASAAPRGVLRASLPGPFGRKHILPLLPEYRDRYPDVSLDLHVSDDIVDIVGDGFDVVVRIATLPDSSMMATKLATNTRMAVATPDFVAKHGRPERPEDIVRFDTIMLRDMYVWRFLKGDERISVRVDSTIHTNSGAVVYDATLMGLGIGIKSIWDIGEDLRAGRLVNLLPGWRFEGDGEIYALRPPNPYTPPKVRAFIDLMKERWGPKPYWETY